MVEAVSGLFSYQQVKGLQFRLIYKLFRSLAYGARTKKLYYLPGDISRGKHAVHLPCLDCRLRQLRELGCGRVLDKYGASLSPDCLDSTDSISTRAGEDDGNGTFGSVFGE